MKISIYQMKTTFETSDLKFRSLDHVMHCCEGRVPEHMYECVFQGKVETSSLDEVFYIFNNEHPLGFTGHSLSISDVICIMDSIYYYCEPTTFIPIPFDGKKCMEVSGENHMVHNKEETKEELRDN